MLALTHPVVTALRFHSPNGRQPARNYQIFCTFIIMLWVGLKEKAHNLQPEVPAEKMYLPTFTGFALLLSREGCQHKGWQVLWVTATVIGLRPDGGETPSLQD